MTIRERPSPNFNMRHGVPIDCIIIHDTQGKTAEGALSWLTSPKAEASSHYLIDKAGMIWRLVPEAERAWHAGKSELFGRLDVNTFSIGVELVDDNDGDSYPSKQLEAAVTLCADLCRRYSLITLNRIVGHEHVAPGRKIDPGRDWPWRAFLLEVAWRLRESP